jgi:hypothetical protein
METIYLQCQTLQIHRLRYLPWTSVALPAMDMEPKPPAKRPIDRPRGPRLDGHLRDTGTRTVLSHVCLLFGQRFDISKFMSERFILWFEMIINNPVRTGPRMGSRRRRRRRQVRLLTRPYGQSSD